MSHMSEAKLFRLLLAISLLFVVVPGGYAVYLNQQVNMPSS